MFIWQLEGVSFKQICSHIFFFLVLLLFSNPSMGQLLGHFGFVELPEGFKYRDTETVEASQEAARFWEKFHADEEFRAEQKRRINGFEILSRNVPEFKTTILGLRLGLRSMTAQSLTSLTATFWNHWLRQEVTSLWRKSWLRKAPLASDFCLEKDCRQHQPLRLDFPTDFRTWMNQ